MRDRSFNKAIIDPVIARDTFVYGISIGEELEPTHYWRDRTKHGPTYHIDYIFMPQGWVAAISEMSVGSFEDWSGKGLSDHVPLVIDIDV